MKNDNELLIVRWWREGFVALFVIFCIGFIFTKYSQITPYTLSLSEGAKCQLGDNAEFGINSSISRRIALLVTNDNY